MVSEVSIELAGPIYFDGDFMTKEAPSSFERLSGSQVWSFSIEHLHNWKISYYVPR